MRGWLALLLVAVLSRFASADDDAKAKAKEHADAAGKLYAVQQYDQAAEEWRQAYLLDPDPNYLYATAQAQRLGGDCVKALLSYRAYLRTNPADESKATANIERCEQYLKEHPQLDPVLAPPPPVALPPPTTEPARPQTQMVSSPWTSDWIGHVLVGSGVAVAAAGTVFFVTGRSAIKDANTAATYDEFAAAHDNVDSARTKQTIGVSAMAVGGGLVLGGVLHYVFHTRPHAEPVVSATATPGAASVTLVGSF